MIKFKEKNKENIDKLNKYIDEHREDIRMIIVSPEMFYRECRKTQKSLACG
jgi:hypothetical protein